MSPSEYNKSQGFQGKLTEMGTKHSPYELSSNLATPCSVNNIVAIFIIYYCNINTTMNDLNLRFAYIQYKFN